MKLLTLIRVTSSDKGTFGVLSEAGIPLCVTCELPWKDNQNRISCIPVGTYETTRFKSPSKGDVFLLKDVPDRDMIEMHIANTIKDVLGCIAVGLFFGLLDGMPAVLSSENALKMLRVRYPTGFDLEIKNGF